MSVHHVVVIVMIVSWCMLVCGSHCYVISVTILCFRVPWVMREVIGRHPGPGDPTVMKRSGPRSNEA